MSLREIPVLSTPKLPYLIIFFIIAVFVGGGTVLCQETKTVTNVSGLMVSGRTYSLIPEATEPCTPDECDWWKRVRQAGNDLQKKGDDKSKKRYIAMFVEGMEKSHHVPLSDRKAQGLAFGPMIRSDYLAASQRNGTVELSVEIRSDASIGEIKVVKSLGPEIDQRCISYARQTIYLPAVNNRAFVSSWQNPKFGFINNPHGVRK